MGMLCIAIDSETGAATAEPSGVTRHSPKAFSGWNLYNSRHRAEAHLMDMSGTIVHTWKASSKKPPWMYTLLQKNGDLLVISKNNYLARLNWSSELLWKRRLEAHHDVTVAPDGRIYVLTHRTNRYLHNGANIPIVDDYIVVLSPDGTLLTQHKLFPLLRPLIDTARLDLIKKQMDKGKPLGTLVREDAPSDTTHTNSIQVLPRGIPGIAPAGSILLSVREINRIVILNAKMDRVLFHFGDGVLEEQHHATLVENGNITIFDNGVLRKQSRLIEMDPLHKTVVWTYETPGFYSKLRGSVQKLPNGNMLATESDAGHVFEVTPKGEIVWEFWNPEIAEGTTPPRRGIIYRLLRYPFSYLSGGLLSPPR